MSDKPVVRDYDHQIAPGVEAHTHEETKSGKKSYEHKAETGFEGPGIEGSAYEKTKVTLADDKSADKKHSSDHHHSSGLLGHSVTGSSSGSKSSELTKTSQHGHADSSALTTAADNKPIVRDYDYQPAPGVEAHTHEVIKSGKNTYEHKAETTFEGPNTTGSAYEKTTVKMAEVKK